MHNKIFNEDCMSYLERLKDRSVDAFVFDPPYMGVVTDDWDNQWKDIGEYKDWCEEWISLCSKKAKFGNSFLSLVFHIS